ncbi:uncharacterized protein L3040_001995 [Drepanopeziza brunnea f. sp. 'multigermtubi']|uniref:Developmental regulator protein n=1 Tax=Marssonina brunnea f. sp. multigermtubi (strain MB_m1) TaxID=1072389 RepID=K1WQ09_MARBU|nr:uncharacterized protein MBM_01612 [Drepanopeziza brunnea f. sp. 'multigermtubi' MB_m1]EKD19660.1 hypothetical protein MBM_01612 [Drepanopeziza brunnea f. sp. 'multigermtubi' MB_m1]KAJ5052238.1 hypothetical protein L3040_001995 [Drepanopeziza brunnea f. sp. 'multigermtubi']
MPTFLVHGFRWNRTSIRIHIILNNLDDAAPEWIIAPASSVTLLNSFYTLFDFLPPSNPPPASSPLAPVADQVVTEEEATRGTEKLTKANKSNRSISSLRDLVLRPKSNGVVSLGGGRGKEKDKEDGPNGNGTGSRETKPPAGATVAPTTKTTEKRPTFNDWSVVKLLEQYDPEIETCSQPHAYVADYMVEVSLGVSVAEEMARYEAKIAEEESLLSAPATPLSPEKTGFPTVDENGELASPPLSARDVRRKSRRLNWFEKLRDGLQKEAAIGWHVVVCGDEERTPPSINEDEDKESVEEEGYQKPPRSAGLRGFFGMKN